MSRLIHSDECTLTPFICQFLCVQGMYYGTMAMGLSISVKLPSIFFLCSYGYSLLPVIASFRSNDQRGSAFGGGQSHSPRLRFLPQLGHSPAQSSWQSGFIGIANTAY